MESVRVLIRLGLEILINMYLRMYVVCMYASMFTCMIQTCTTYIYKCSYSDTYIHASIRSEIRPLFPHDRQDSSMLFVPYTCIEKSLKSKVFMDEEFFFFPVPSTSSFSSESPGRWARAAAKKGWTGKPSHPSH